MKKLMILLSLILLVVMLGACSGDSSTAAPTESQAVVPDPTDEPEPAEEPEPTEELTEEPEPTEEPAPELTEESEPTAEPELELAAVIVTASMEGFEAPVELSAGWTAVTLVNESDGQRQAALFRFEEGKTMEDLAAAMAEGTQGVPPWLTPIGGPSGVFPGGSGTAVVNFQAGDYVMLDPVPDDNGVPGVAKGYILPLTVTEAEAIPDAPEAGLTLEMVDYTYNLDEEALAAGQQTIRILNSGPQEAHEVAIIKLNEDATVEDFLAAIAPDASPGPPPGMGVAGLTGLGIGEEAYLTVEFEPATTYGLICFLPSSQNQGTPHFMLGMIGQFTVPAE